MVPIIIIVLAVVTIIAFIVMGAVRRAEYAMSRFMLHAGIVLVVIVAGFLLIHGVSLPKLGNSSPFSNTSTKQQAKEACSKQGSLDKVKFVRKTKKYTTYRCLGTNKHVKIPR